jgi:Pyridoxal phosphate biosynthetic protein PdxA
MLEVDALTDAKDANLSSKAVQCVDLKPVPDDLPFGKMSPIAGEAAYRYIEKDVQVVQAGLAQGICTAPLSKEALQAAGHKYPGAAARATMSGIRNTPPISISSPRVTMVSRPCASVLRQRRNGGGVVVDDGCVFSAGQFAKQHPQMAVALTALARRQIVFQRHRIPHCRHRGFDGGFGEHGAAKVAVQHRSGQIERRT